MATISTNDSQLHRQLKKVKFDAADPDQPVLFWHGLLHSGTCTFQQTIQDFVKYNDRIHATGAVPQIPHLENDMTTSSRSTGPHSLSVCQAAPALRLHMSTPLLGQERCIPTSSQSSASIAAQVINFVFIAGLSRFGIETPSRNDSKTERIQL